MSGFTDYHAHFVYGVDDGARTREEMFAMLDAAAADGVTRLFATSHSTPGMEPFPRDVYQRHLDFARAYCAEKGYDLMLESGSELLYTPAAAYAAAEHSLVTLGGTDWVLLEFVPDVAAAEVETALRQITGSGYRVLLAHIERYPRLARSGALPRLKEQYGIRCQVNAATVLEGGFFQRRKLDRWLKDGLVDAISSDAHNCTTRATRMQAAYERLCGILGQPDADALTGRNNALLLTPQNSQNCHFRGGFLVKVPKARREFPTEMAFWLFFARKNLLKERLRDKIIRNRGICLHMSGGDMDENSGRRRRTACDQFSDPYLVQSGTGLRLYQCDDHR